jgi:hypothetical protein
MARVGLPAARRAEFHEGGATARVAAGAAAAAGGGHEAAEDEGEAQETRHDGNLHRRRIGSLKTRSVVADDALEP